MVQGFIFKKEDKDGGSTKNSVVFSKSVAGQSGDNSVPLIY